MLEHGEWIPHNPGHRRRGYKLTSLYSPIGFLSWRDIVEEFLEAKNDNDIEKLKTWVNTRLAETWDESEEPIINTDSLFNRREEYGPIVPMRLCLPPALTSRMIVLKSRLKAGALAKNHGQ